MSDNHLLALWLHGHTLSAIASFGGVTVSRIKDRLRLLRQSRGLEAVPLRAPGNPAGQHARDVAAVRWAA